MSVRTAFLDGLEGPCPKSRKHDCTCLYILYPSLIDEPSSLHTSQSARGLPPLIPKISCRGTLPTLVPFRNRRGSPRLDLRNPAGRSDGWCWNSLYGLVYIGNLLRKGFIRNCFWAGKAATAGCQSPNLHAPSALDTLPVGSENGAATLGTEYPLLDDQRNRPDSFL